MSLINEMLRDLDRRAASAEPESAGVMSRLVTPGGTRSAGSRYQWLFRIALLLVLIFAGGVVFWVYDHDRLQFEPRLSGAGVLAPPAVATILSPPAAMLAAANPEPRPEPLVDIGRLTLSEIENGTRIEVPLSAEVDHSVVTTGPNQLLIRLPHTRLTQRLPLLTQSRLVDAIDIARENDQLGLRLDLAQAAAVQSYLLNSDGRVSLIVELVAPPVTDPPMAAVLATAPWEKPGNQAAVVGAHPGELATAPNERSEERVDPALAVSKTYRQFSPAERDREAVRRAMVLLKSKLRGQAIVQLAAFISAWPEAKNSRQTLVTLLLEDRQFDRAELLLSAGLELTPQSMALLKLQARLWLAQGQSAHAIELLVANLAVAEVDVEYLSLLAYLYQSENKHKNALEIYQRLARLQQTQAKWRVGQAVSLEALGLRQEALQAYNKARTSPRIDFNLKQYVTDRIAALN